MNECDLWAAGEPTTRTQEIQDFITREAESRWGKQAWKYRKMVSKRFTDAELAAEVHAANADLLASYATDQSGQQTRRYRDQYWTLHRLATQPSYDTEDQP